MHNNEAAAKLEYLNYSILAKIRLHLLYFSIIINTSFLFAYPSKDTISKTRESTRRRAITVIVLSSRIAFSLLNNTHPRQRNHIRVP